MTIPHFSEGNRYVLRTMSALLWLEAVGGKVGLDLRKIYFQVSDTDSVLNSHAVSLAGPGPDRGAFEPSLTLTSTTESLLLLQR